MAECRFCRTPFRSAQAVRAHLKGCAAYKARIASPKLSVDPAERTASALLRAYEGLEQLALTIRKAIRRLKHDVDDAKLRAAFDARARQALREAAEDLDDWQWFEQAVADAKTSLEVLIRPHSLDAAQVEPIYKGLVGACAEWANDAPGESAEEESERGERLLKEAVADLRSVMAQMMTIAATLTPSSPAGPLAPA